VKEKDTLRICDYDLMRSIVEMEREDLWRFVVSRIDQIRAMDERLSMFVVPAPHTVERVRLSFDDFFDEDEGETRQMLINDLCYHGEPVPIGLWAKCGYLDDPSSAVVPTSQTVLPWPRESEAWYWAQRFDLLSAEHVRLMSASLKKNRDQVPPDEYAIQKLQLDNLARACDDPSVRVAYFYQT
jgi:hypothetical protein